jgi:hypothetical protein
MRLRWPRRQQRPRFTSCEITPENKYLVEPSLRDYGDLYEVYDCGVLIGITDEYLTCYWARVPLTREDVEDLLMEEDGTPRDIEIGLR